MTLVGTLSILCRKSGSLHEWTSITFIWGWRWNTVEVYAACPIFQVQNGGVARRKVTCRYKCQVGQGPRERVRLRPIFGQAELIGLTCRLAQPRPSQSYGWAGLGKFSPPSPIQHILKKSWAYRPTIELKYKLMRLIISSKKLIKLKIYKHILTYILDLTPWSC